MALPSKITPPWTLGQAREAVNGLIDHLASTPTGGTDPEVVRDTIAAALVAGTGVSITPNDAADTITISATGSGDTSIKVGGTEPSSGWWLDNGTSGGTPPPGDTTPPTGGTLAASAITSGGFTLTVSGASDAVGLHATPYAFSTDNGATWSAWQAGATYNATGLAASTAYQARHKVRDAALNEATGTAITVTTTAAGPTVITDDFTAPDGTLVNNTRTTPVGGLTWATDIFGASAFEPTDHPLQITGNKAASTPSASSGAGVDARASYVNTATSHVRAHLTYTANASVTTSAMVRLTIAAVPASGSAKRYFCIVYQPKQNGAYVTKNTGSGPAVVGSVNGATDVLTGTIEIEWDGTTLTAWHNDNVVYTGTQALAGAGTAVGVGMSSTATAGWLTVDDLQITYLS